MPRRVFPHRPTSPLIGPACALYPLSSNGLLRLPDTKKRRSSAGTAAGSDYLKKCSRKNDERFKLNRSNNSQIWSITTSFTKCVGSFC